MICKQIVPQVLYARVFYSGIPSLIGVRRDKIQIIIFEWQAPLQVVLVPVETAVMVSDESGWRKFTSAGLDVSKWAGSTDSGPVMTATAGLFGNSADGDGMTNKIVLALAVGPLVSSRSATVWRQAVTGNTAAWVSYWINRMAGGTGRTRATTKAGAMAERASRESCDI